jgi:hypothetical protein
MALMRRFAVLQYAVVTIMCGSVFFYVPCSGRVTSSRCGMAWDYVLRISLLQRPKAAGLKVN